MTRPDEKEHIMRFTSFNEAARFAKLMSDQFDDSTVLVALAKRRDGGLNAVGHIDYTFGIEIEREGYFV